MPKGKPKTKWIDPDDAPEMTQAQFDRAEIRDGDALIRSGDGFTVPQPEHFPSPALLAEIRAMSREFSVFEAKYPSIAKAAQHIGPALGLGPINTAEAILLWQHWIGHGGGE